MLWNEIFSLYIRSIPCYYAYVSGHCLSGSSSNSASARTYIPIDRLSRWRPPQGPFLARPLAPPPPAAALRRPRRLAVAVGAAASPDRKPPGTVASTTNYVVPLDAAPSGITRPLVEILRDLNKRVPDTIVRSSRRASASDPVVPWYHANRMLSFYAPGWCGEVRDVIYADSGKVTVVYRVTVRGTDGEVHREAAGTASLNDARFDDPVAAAEEAAFCKACARFGFGLYLYHEDETP